MQIWLGKSPLLESDSSICAGRQLGVKQQRGPGKYDGVESGEKVFEGQFAKGHLYVKGIC